MAPRSSRCSSAARSASASTRNCHRARRRARRALRARPSRGHPCAYLGPLPLRVRRNLRSRDRSTSRASQPSYRSRPPNDCCRARSRWLSGAPASVSRYRLSRGVGRSCGQVGERVQRRDQRVDRRASRSNGRRAMAPGSRAIAASSHAGAPQPLDRPSSRVPPNDSALDRRSARRTPSGGSLELRPAASRRTPRRTAARPAPRSAPRTADRRAASTGRSRSRSAQKPWIVLTCASSSARQRLVERCRASGIAPRRRVRARAPRAAAASARRRPSR